MFLSKSTDFLASRDLLSVDIYTKFIKALVMDAMKTNYTIQNMVKSETNYPLHITHGFKKS